jgi:signal transduction histidine kinase
MIDNPGAGLPDQEITQGRITRVLVFGFALVIVLLSVGGSAAFRNVLSIRENAATLVREEQTTRHLIEELQDQQKTLSAIFCALTGDPDNADPARISANLDRAEITLEALEREARPTAEQRVLWGDLLQASHAFAVEARRLPSEESATLGSRELFRRHEEVVFSMSRLVGEGFRRISRAESEIDRRATRFTRESVLLLGASLVLALLCSVFTVRLTRRLFRNMAWQENELARVSWQMLSDQESIARRFSHELHDELGQTLAALKANLAAAGNAPRIEDSTRLADDAIRNVRELSQLLRPMILDDFGLDAGLNWLCEGFMHRTGIEVDYRSNHHSRLPDETETQLFRIAQEALTNVARHSGATRVTVDLKSTEAEISLTIADNGKGIAAHMPSPGNPSMGMTGMRARTRVAGGSFRAASPKEGGFTVEARIPIPLNSEETKEEHEPHPNSAG